MPSVERPGGVSIWYEVHGAASGMGQCFMNQKKLRAALRVYRRANRLNPNLEGVREAIQSLERILGEEGRR